MFSGIPKSKIKSIITGYINIQQKKWILEEGKVIINLLAGITTEAINKMAEAGSENLQETAKMAVSFLELGTRLMQESPEFREAFARVHTEFFKYPESADTVRQALSAVGNSLSGGLPQH